MSSARTSRAPTIGEEVSDGAVLSVLRSDPMLLGSGVLTLLAAPALLWMWREVDSSTWPMMSTAGIATAITSGIVFARLQRHDALKKTWLLLGCALVTVMLASTVFLAITTPASSELDRGWHEREGASSLNYYWWTGPETESTFHFATPLVPNSLVLSFNVPYSIAADVLDSLQVFVNERPISLTRRDVPGPRFSGSVPRRFLNGRQADNVLRLSVNRTIRPVDIGMNRDERRIGLAINRLELYPALLPGFVVSRKLPLTEITFLLGLVGFLITSNGLLWQARRQYSGLIRAQALQLLLPAIVVGAGITVTLVIFARFVIDGQISAHELRMFALLAAIVSFLSVLVLRKTKGAAAGVLSFCGVALLILAVVPGLWPAAYNPSPFIEGKGWYPGFDDPPYGTVRWSGPGTRSVLYFSSPAAPGDQILGLSVPHAVSADVLGSLTLKVNDHPIPVKRVDQRYPFMAIIQGSIPAQFLYAGSATNELVMELDRTLSRKDLGLDEDTNTMGVAINQVRLSPVAYGKLVGLLTGLVTELQLVLLVAGLALISSGLIWKTWHRPITLRASDWPSFQALRSLRVGGAVSWIRFLVLGTQLALLYLAAQTYELQGPVFYQTVMPLVLIGFLAYYLLPRARHESFLVVLSLIAISSIFGFPANLWLVGLGLGLIGLCHLPVSYRLRIALLVLAGVGLAMLRSDWISSPALQSIWPVLGSMFMFRLILYMVDLERRPAPVNMGQTLSYFFLLPNVAFLLFPPIDFTTFRRSYSTRDRDRVVQTGLGRILQGFVYVLLHSIVVAQLAVHSGDVRTLTDLIAYVLVTFLFTLQLFGQFHVIIGVLNVVGYDLPPVTQYFYLSPTFGDIWRRVNVYWKDFIQRLVFHPAYLSLPRLHVSTRLLLAAGFAFFATWFFHAYQWFWLKGAFLLIWTDILFWAILAGFMLFELAYQSRRRPHPRTNLSWPETLRLGAQTTAVMSTLCILWSLWSSSSVGSWLALWESATIRPDDLVVAGLGLGGAVIVFGLIHRALNGRGEAPVAINLHKGPRSALTVVASTLLLLIVTRPSLNTALPPSLASAVFTMKTAELSSRDRDLIRQGYYENVQVNWLTTNMNNLDFARRLRFANVLDLPIYRRVDSFRFDEWHRGSRALFKDVPFAISQWGMRDRFYEKRPASNVFRIALLGASSEAGVGVVQEKTFEALVEQRLNRDGDGTGLHYEILNFSMLGRTLPQQAADLEEQVIAFEPAAALITMHPNFSYNDPHVEAARGQATAAHFVRLVRGGIEIPYPELAAILERAGVQRNMSGSEVYRRLRPFDDEIASWAIRRIGDLSRRHEIQPVLVFLPDPEPVEPTAADFIAGKIEFLTRTAEQEGFVVLNLLDVFDGHEPRTLQISGWDVDHPNAYGHRLIADRLYEALTTNDRITPRARFRAEEGRTAE